MGVYRRSQRLARKGCYTKHYYLTTKIGSRKKVHIGLRRNARFSLRKSARRITKGVIRFRKRWDRPVNRKLLIKVLIWVFQQLKKKKMAKALRIIDLGMGMG